jgi:predicted dinucleotide-binding enzyme
MIFLAVPFPPHKDVARKFKQWNGKIVVDVTNAFDVEVHEPAVRLYLLRFA